MEAFDDPSYRLCLDAVDMVNPDGVPLVWALKLIGQRDASRVYGPSAMLAVIAAAEKSNVPVAFYGGAPKVLDKLISVVELQHPLLKISLALSPPFRPLSQAEDAAIVEQISSSGARILFVGLGCPKQERWMVSHLGRIPAVMFGVGAAFDFIAGTKRQAPSWMMRIGLEWLFRFACEPRRLARRYIKHNPRFVFLLICQLFRHTGR